MNTFGVNEVLKSLHDKLRDYLEAQYHIADEGIIEERKLLLNEPGTISQVAYIESTPIYKPGYTYDKVNIPECVKTVFEHLSQLKPDVGIYPKPYVHQINAIESFITEKKDLIVTTGTGSGKTECFLLPILANIIKEASIRPETYKVKGMRALLLYPMNALVSDQLGRLRKMVGDERVVDLFQKKYGRQIRFGMYTSRTPYPGLRTSRKDQKHIKDVLQYYVNTMRTTPELMQKLKERGRWPAKDIMSFYGCDGEQWKSRLITSKNDAELFTRHEIQDCCPDILITNYSMLEYMLMRPIERSIFDQTKEWLHSDPENKLVLVLDEAHMYRGAAGAEVALLIRRLQNRLCIPREKMQCILTSASIGGGENTEKIAIEFAENLTGKPMSGDSNFKLILGVKEERIEGKPGTINTANALANFRLDAFMQRECNPGEAMDALKKLSNEIKWDFNIDNAGQIPEYVYERLTGFEPMELLIDNTSGNAKEFYKLASDIFPFVESHVAQNALSSLLALGTAAKKNGKVLLPTRLHLFYRGIPGLFACINPKCEEKRNNADLSGVIGRLYTEMLLNCSCSKKARIFEILTHRDCGGTFIRAFYRPDNPNFLWNEKGGTIGQGYKEVHIYLGKLHKDAINYVEPIWIDITTGIVRTERPEITSDFVAAYRPINNKNETKKKKKSDDINTFDRCPCCTELTRNKIMDLATKGEQPFANLVRQQLLLQPPLHKPDKFHPNAGRKVLLFSDGRQKAARLARDIPREVELDTFRQVILLAAKYLIDINVEPTLTKKLYTAFIDIVARHNLFFFDGESQETLRRDVTQYVNDYINNDEGLEEAINEWERTEPDRYLEALLRQFCYPHYNIYSSCVAYLEPTSRVRKRIEISLADIGIAHEELKNLFIVLIMRMMESLSFNADIHEGIRYRVAQYSDWGDEGKFSKRARRLIKECLSISDEQINKVESVFYNNLCTIDKNNKYYIAPDKVKVTLAADTNWYRCDECTQVAPVSLNGKCVFCGSNEVKKLTNDNPYMQARKGFWRSPVLAVLQEKTVPSHVTVEEHTAQISQRDIGMVYASTEQYELQFQDIWLDGKKGPVDVLSCTTTMEVGIDIGSLTAVGLRNVPPARENYQQRAGRAGRRGSSLSTVLTYSQGGPHDSYYFKNPALIISGEPREPKIYINNKKIAQRHINALLFQTFFHEKMDITEEDYNAGLMSTLGKTHDFFSCEGDFNLGELEKWITENILGLKSDFCKSVALLLPDDLFIGNINEVITDKIEYIKDTAISLLKELRRLEIEVQNTFESIIDSTEEIDEIEDELDNNLLEFLFSKGLLPTYAFPTDLTSFYVQKWDDNRKRVVIEQRPQQSMAKALSEYAPGRLIVIDKKTYRSGGIFKPNPNHAIDKGQIIDWNGLPFIIYCDSCSYVTQTDRFKNPGLCPLCNDELKIMPMLEPIGFSPESGRALSERDREQELSYASSPQFPLPTEEEKLDWSESANTKYKYAFANDKTLIVINKGPLESGFDICTSCGAAWAHGDFEDKHKRPYILDKRLGRNIEECTGEMKNVLLGHSFNSDLLILRFSLDETMDSNPYSMWIQDSLRTFSEAMTLAASRVLDIDYNELSAGYRFIPRKGNSTSKSEIDVFLFDTLSGGAGYSFAAGKQIKNVLNYMEELLSECNCSSSCYKCLRHYGNQFYHHQLNRFLALDLLRYIRDSKAPGLSSVHYQIEKLQPLRRMLDLQGIHTKINITVNGIDVPLLIENRGRRVAIGVYNSLLDSEKVQHPIDALSDVIVYKEREYSIIHDLPSVGNNVIKLL